MYGTFHVSTIPAMSRGSMRMSDENPMKIASAVPVLEVNNVEASMDWYREMLGFQATSFPEAPPYSFAILLHGETELMLQRATEIKARNPQPYRWNVYLRFSGGQLRTLYQTLTSRGVVSRRLERMFYGLAEFEITDPDGYVLCLSEELEDQEDLPTPTI